MRIRQFLSISVAILTGVLTQAQAQPAPGQRQGIVLADSFYKHLGSDLSWFGPDTKWVKLRASVQLMLDSADHYGLNAGDYITPKLPERPAEAELKRLDRQFTITVINFARDLYSGSDIARHIKSDEISPRYKTQTERFLLSWLLELRPGVNARSHFAQLEPKDRAYHLLKTGLREQMKNGRTNVAAGLAESMNISRWIDHFHFDKYIVVNIPSATLSLFENDTEQLSMKVVVGKPATRTPRFATWCDKVILYPYWNVPASIARKELLPVFKRSPGKVEAMKMQVLNRNGKVIDPNTIRWSAFNSGYFPYTLRQCTGCDNALGVIKYNLTDPFNVYMHDTNYKLAFSSDARYFSHGCIRLEQPVALGNALLNNKLDSNFLKACLKDQEPVTVIIEKPVPVFVIYLTTTATDSAVLHHKDVYRLGR